MDTRMDAERVTANSRKRRPTIPPINRRGMKTAISEMLMVKTVKPISAAPFNAAAKGFMPFSRWRVIFRSESAHQQKRNEDGNQRNADGEDGETDLCRTFQRRGKGLHAVFQMARDILHHYDRIVDHKPR